MKTVKAMVHPQAARSRLVQRYTMPCLLSLAYIARSDLPGLDNLKQMFPPDYRAAAVTATSR